MTWNTASVHPIIIATSIAPHELANQQKAVESWISQGFHVVSLNAFDEMEMLSPLFPNVNFVQVTRDARKQYGKPLVFFDDILAFFRQRTDRICGIMNSDVILNSQYSLSDFFCREAQNGLVFGSRIDVDNLASLQGKMYNGGFVFFFFDRLLLKVFPAE